MIPELLFQQIEVNFSRSTLYLVEWKSKKEILKKEKICGLILKNVELIVWALVYWLSEQTGVELISIVTDSSSLILINYWR